MYCRSENIFKKTANKKVFEIVYKYFIWLKFIYSLVSGGIPIANNSALTSSIS